MAERMEVGDYDYRVREAEKALAGEITGTVIGAAWRVRAEWRNGFPCWDMYRAAIAGDSLYLRELRQWTVAFAIVTATDGAVRSSVYSEEFACVAAWDALSIFLWRRELQPYTVTAAALGLHHRTYKRFRDMLALRLEASHEEYFSRLVAAYKATQKAERKCGS
jgi:hypothetical protein